MAGLPILRPTELIRVIERKGFVKDRQSGGRIKEKVVFRVGYG